MGEQTLKPFAENTSLSLLDRLVHQNQASDWHVFVSIYQPLIQKQLSRCGLSGADADDIAQESLAAIFEAIHGFRHNGRAGAFRKWVKKILIQRIWRFKEKQKKAPASESDIGKHVSMIADDWQAQMNENWELEHDRFVLDKLLQLIRVEFTESTWSAFVAQVMESRSAREVAKSLGVSVNAVLLAKSRVLKRLRAIGAQLIEA